MSIISLDLAGFALIGLLIGSFVNVLIYRLPRMILNEADAAESTSTPSSTKLSLAWPASHCPQCLTPIRWFHNLPLVSFVWLKGHCHHCHEPISWLYPFNELFTACLWFACAWHWGVQWSTALWACLATGLYSLSVIDWRTTLLPDTLTLGLVWLGLLAASAGLLNVTPAQSIVGCAAGYGSLWALARLYQGLTHREGMGAGDFKLFAAIGAWLGWPILPFVALISSVLGLMVALGLMSLKRMKKTDYLPFGPFLAASAWIVAWVSPDAFIMWAQNL